MTKAKEIMTTDVASIQGSSTIAEAVKLMKEKGLRTIIVEPRSKDDPYGIVTETDIVGKVVSYGHDPKQMRVYEIMTKPCIVVNPDLEIEYVARLFAQTRIRCAPVIQDGLLGIISVSDILRKSDFVEHPKQIFIEDRIEAARAEALAICEAQGSNSPACAAAWDALEEIRAEAAHQRSKKKAGVIT